MGPSAAIAIFPYSYFTDFKGDMEKNILVHTCEPGRKCRCREYKSAEEAALLVKNGVADYEILSQQVSQTEETCSHCLGNESLKKACAVCKGKGTVTKNNTFPIYGKNIRLRADKRIREGKKHASPRSQTIERPHIERALDGNRVDQQRIIIYGRLDKIMLAALGAELLTGDRKKVIRKGKPEPEDNPKTMTGRRYDYGKPV